MQIKNGFLFVCGGFLAIAAILLVVGNSFAAGGTTSGVNLSEYQGTISVTGNGYVYVTPDLAQVSISVVTEDATSTKAMADNANAMDKVIRAVKQLGIADKDIKTSQISLQPKYSYDYPDARSTYYPTPLRQNITGYTATNTLTITIRDLSKVGQVIDAAYNAGSNEINGVTFMLSEDLQSVTYKQALEKAVRDGSGRAGTIATAAGIGGIKLKTISESSPYFPVYYESFSRSDAKAASSVAPTTVSPGEQKVSATVSMTYVYLPQ